MSLPLFGLMPARFYDKRGRPLATDVLDGAEAFDGFMVAPVIHELTTMDGRVFDRLTDFGGTARFHERDPQVGAPKDSE